MLKLEEQLLGKFEVNTPHLLITDPCYSKDVNCLGVVDNAKIGVWEAYITVSDEGMWGKRVSNLVTYHKEQLNSIAHDSFLWQRTNHDIGVDSGMAGVFNADLIPATREGCNNPVWDNWYSSLYKDESKAKVIEGGVVSSSGYGDGGYDSYLITDAHGEVIAIKIEFITDDEDYDEDTEDWDEEEV